MNEVFERLSDVFEELRSDAGEREYSIQTEEAKKADKELKKENRDKGEKSPYIGNLKLHTPKIQEGTANDFPKEEDDDLPF